MPASINDDGFFRNLQFSHLMPLAEGCDVVLLICLFSRDGKGGQIPIGYVANTCFYIDFCVFLQYLFLIKIYPVGSAQRIVAEVCILCGCSG